MRPALGLAVMIGLSHLLSILAWKLCEVPSIKHAKSRTGAIG